MRRSPPLLAAAVATALLVALSGPGLSAAFGSSLPPPTPVPPRRSPSPFPTVLHTPRPSLSPPRIKAAAAILEDLETGQVLFRKSSRARRPIASLTKIMTAFLVLGSHHLADTVTVREDATVVTPPRLGLRRGERIPVGDLVYALLLQSANDAAVALADHISGSVPKFVRFMNVQARRLGLRDTHFMSPSGLDDRGFSTAQDVATLTRAAYRLPAFAGIVQTKFGDVPAPKGPPRHIQNRNVLLWLYRGALGVKTGFTTPAGHCLVGAARRAGTRLVTVILGDRKEPFDAGATLLNYGFVAFERLTLIHRGERVGAVRVGSATVQAVAEDDLARLVPRKLEATVRRVMKATRGLSLPIVAGQRIGRFVVLAGGRPIGSVAALAETTVVPAPAPPPGWLVALRRAVSVTAALVRVLVGAFL